MFARNMVTAFSSKRAALVLVAACMFSFACSSTPGVASTAGTCPNDVPVSCPTPAPTYSGDAAPVLRKYCTSCHSPDGVAGYDMTTYATAFAQRSEILDQVDECIMPTAGNPSPSESERLALLGWLVCGAPDD
jgi:hypothetical protein